jgi:hypothetical protein
MQLRSNVKPRIALTLGSALAIAAVLAGAERRVSGTGPPSVFALRVAGEAGAEYGTATLIHRAVRGDQADLYFITSSCFFRATYMEGRLLTRPVELILDEAHSITIAPKSVFMPSGTCVDVAVFHVAAAADIAAVPQPVTFDSLRIGTGFLVHGFDHDGRPVAVAQEIRFRATLQVIGDREISSLRGCLGAPAVTPRGVFGVVTECLQGRAPAIALLSVSRRLLEVHISPSSPRS